jgi:hypothetical protein
MASSTASSDSDVVLCRFGSRPYAVLELTLSSKTFRFVHNRKAKLGSGVNGTFEGSAPAGVPPLLPERIVLKPTSAGEHADFSLESCQLITIYRSEDVEVRGSKFVGFKHSDEDDGSWLDPDFEE